MAELLIQYASAAHIQARSRAGPSAPVWWAGRISWLIVATALLGGVACLIGLRYSELMAFLSPLGTMLAVVAIAVLVGGLRRSWDSATLEYLEQAIRLNLPIPPMLRAAEVGEARFVRKRIRRLRAQIEEGASVGDSLFRALPGLASRVHGLIVSGERCGRLAPVLRRIVEQDRRRVECDPVQRIYLRWYPIMILLTLGAVITGIDIFVMPKFSKISSGFHLTMPWTSMWRALSNVGEFAFPIAGALAIFVCAQLMVNLIHPRYSGPGPLWRATDRLIWYLPVVRSVVRGRALGDACELIGGAIESGMTLHDALAEASEVRTNVVLQHRLRHWAAGIESGLSSADAARAAQMPAIVSGLIAPADATADLSNAFSFLTRYYDGQFSRAALLLGGAVIPGISIVFGSLTMLVLLSVFLPMIEMIKHLMPVTMSW